MSIKKRFYSRGSFSRTSDTRIQMMDNIIGKMNKLGYKIYPSTTKYTRGIIQRAEKRGVIKKDRDFGVVTAALLVAGAQEARSEGSNTIRVKHIKEGWNIQLNRGPGNCPPYKCARRSVIQVEEELKTTLPNFKNVINVVDESEVKGEQ